MTLTKNQKMKRKIVSCAKKLFSKQGYINTSMRQISTQMGFKNQASLYYYYRHKKLIGRELFNNYYNKLDQYLLSLPDIQKDEFLYLPLREVCNCHLVLMTPKVLSFMIEVDSDSIFTIREAPEDLYYESIFTLMKKKNPSMSSTEVKIALSYYIAGFLRILRDWNQDTVEISQEEFIMQVPSVLLWLLRFDEKEIETMVEKARKIYSTFPEEDLSRLKFF